MSVLEIFWILLSGAPIAALLVARRMPRTATRVLAVWFATGTLYMVLMSWFGAFMTYGQTTMLGKLLGAATIGAVLFPGVALWNGLRRGLFLPLVAGLILVWLGLRADDLTLAQHIIWIGGLAGAVVSGALLFDRRLEQGDAWFALGPPILLAIGVVAWSTLSRARPVREPPEAPSYGSALNRDWADELIGARTPPDSASASTARPSPFLPLELVPDSEAVQDTTG